MTMETVSFKENPLFWITPNITYICNKAFLEKSFINKSFVTERDQCPRRRFDTELKECQLQSKTNYIIVENSSVKIHV